MEFSLKSLKIHRDLSEETLCYSATLLIDGKPAFTCANRGHGGCDTNHQIGSHTIAEVEQYIRENTPNGVVLFDFSSPIECLVGRLIDLDDASRLLKRKLKTSFLFIENGTIQSFKPSGGRKFDEAWGTAFAIRRPELQRITTSQNWQAAIDILTAPTDKEQTQ